MMAEKKRSVHLWRKMIMAILNNPQKIEGIANVNAIIPPLTHIKFAVQIKEKGSQNWHGAQGHPSHYPYLPQYSSEGGSYPHPIPLEVKMGMRNNREMAMPFPLRELH
eukprot:2091707-Ditylum_brightwellii.AAC.2